MMLSVRVGPWMSNPPEGGLSLPTSSETKAGTHCALPQITSYCDPSVPYELPPVKNRVGIL